MGFFWRGRIWRWKGDQREPSRGWGDGHWRRNVSPVVFLLGNPVSDQKKKAQITVLDSKGHPYRMPAFVLICLFAVGGLWRAEDGRFGDAF